jgi:hypothetical protein
MIIDNVNNKAYRLTNEAKQSLYFTKFTEWRLYNAIDEETELFEKLGILEEMDTIHERDREYGTHDRNNYTITINDKTYCIRNNDLELHEEMPFFCTTIKDGDEHFTVYFMISMSRNQGDFDYDLYDDRCFIYKD